MKRTLTLISLITLISFYAKAQDSEDKVYAKSYLALIGGISNPQGDFANSTYENFKSGFAKRGATFGFESAVYVYKNLGIGANFSFTDQGELTTPDVQTLANGYNNQLKVNSTLVQGVNRYHSLSLMLGPQYSFQYHKFTLDLRADAGIYKSTSTPQLLIYVTGNPGTQQTITQHSSKGAVLGYGGNAGLRWEFAEGWDIGVHLNYIKANLNIKTDGDVSALGSNGRDISKQPVTVLQSTFGIAVHL